MDISFVSESMIIKQVKYLQSGPTVKECPPPNLPEYAFTGRSNVGKSSLINMLANRNKLAFVSKQPGKTITINHYLINNNWYLVDLPGYGFAKRSKELRGAWEDNLEEYVKTRENLQCVFVLVDSRMDPQENDIGFINALGEWQVPCAIIFTKTDKNNQSETAKKVNKFKAELSKYWDELPQMFLTSSVEKKGRDKILDFVEKTNKDFKY